MSAQELFDLLSQYPLFVLGYFLLLPLVAAGLGVLQPRHEEPPTLLDYVYSMLVYMAGVPGSVSTVLIAYSLFIVRTNLLEVDFLIYFLPVISMGMTFYLIGRKTEFDRLPGFERLSGLMMLIGLTFLVILIIFKLRIFVGFFASVESFLLLGLILFVLFKVAAKKLF
jgi:hypothetical protein